jgi:hypothetical protein
VRVRLARRIDGRLARRLSATTGAPPHVSRALLDLAARRAGAADYAARSAAFLLATSAAGRRLLPERLRRRAVAALLHQLFRDPAELLFFYGLRHELDLSGCRGLLPADGA